MYRYLGVFFCSIFFVSQIASQQITGQITDGVGNPLIGANVFWEGTTIGTNTETDGTFIIENYTGLNRTLVFSYIGYKEERIKVGELDRLDLSMIEDYTLEEIQISEKEKATRFADSAAKIEVIGRNEIERAACCSLAGCFSTNSNVEAATTNVITDAKELQILGLSGVYNQVLFDDMPLIQGLAFQYGSGSYPGTMINNIFVAKGANSVLQGGQSISGQINILPYNSEDVVKLFLNGFVTSFGDMQYNVNYSVKGKKSNNFTTAHLTTPANLRDKDRDGFRDIVRTNRISFFNKFVFDDPDKDGIKLQLGLRFWKEEREGGQMDFDADQDLGSNTIYGQHVDLNQLEAYLKANRKITDDFSISFQASVFGHNQISHFGIKQYDADQTNITSNLFFDYFYGKNDNNLKFGLAAIKNTINEEIKFLDEISFLTYDGIYLQQYFLPGAYAEHTINLEKITLITGLRADIYDEIGVKFVPRLLLRYKLSEQSDLRLSVGKGVRIPHIFSERINLLSSNRDVIFEDEIFSEEAVNIGANYIHSIFLENIDITLSADAYYTIFQNQVIPDYDRAIGKAYVSNFYGKSASESIQFESKFEFFTQYDLKLAYNYLNLYQEREGVQIEQPFVPRHKVLVSNSFSTADDDWQFDLSYKWFSQKRLPNTTDYPMSYQIADYSEAYGLLNMQITKRWYSFELYGGIENIMDFRQEFPILASDDPFGPYFDPSFNWGPTKGREVYMGFRYNLE